MRVFFTDGVSNTLVELNDGDEVPLVPPVQGGHVMFIGAAARNLDGCNVELDGRLREPTTNEQLGRDARTTNFIVDADGWGRSDPAQAISNTANVNVCPNYSPHQILGRALPLELTVTDRKNRRASAMRTVVPRCMLPNAAEQELCLCECAPDYVLGRCNVDGGARDL